MHGRIFRVDLSDEARDFQATATEPGLAMLDRNSANHAILRRWLDDLVAEPEWTEGDSVNFYVYSEERGRVERVDIRPAKKSDLEGPLQGELEALRAQIKKVKPESSTEELLHRIVRQTFARLTNDLSQSDHDSYFFKYREPGGSWKLLWCWGYQRKDAQPATAIICSNSECEQLFVRRARTKPLCPGCQKIVRKKSAAAAVLSGRSLLILLLLLLAGAALLGILNPPHLVVTPEQWNVPVSSRVEFKVAEHKWYFFKKDVTPVTHPQSHDSRVLDFAKVGPVAYAKAIGTTWVTFRHKDRVADVQVTVGPPSPPSSLEIVPAQVRLGIGSTAKLKVQGIYDGGATVDVTDLIQWNTTSEEIVFVHEGRLEGLKPGTVLVNAAYPSSTGDAALEASANVQVAQVDYQSLDVTLDPTSIGVDEYGQLDVFALDEAGEKYSFLGSSQLALVVSPLELAEVEQDEYLVGRQQGSGEVTAKVSDLSHSLSFSVGQGTALAAGTFSVTPEELSLRMHEYYDVDVATASDAPIDVVSSDSEVVEVIAGTEIAGRSPGTAEVTFSQGGNSQVIKVTVVESNIETIKIIPSLITLRVGEASSLRVVGVSPEGEEWDLAPAELTWRKQPAADYADFDRQSLQFFGLATTGEPEPLVVQFGEDMLAEAQVEVVGSPLAVDLAADFLVPHPPLRVGPSLVNPGAYLGGNYVFDNGGLMVRGIAEGSPLLAAGIPVGSVITGVNGGLFEGLTAGELGNYFLEHPIADGDIIQYRTPDGQLLEAALGLSGRFVQEVRLIGVEPFDLTASNFSAQLQLELRSEAEYRLVDAEGNVISDWQRQGPKAIVTMNSSMTRNADDEYELFIERRIGEKVRRFQLPFKLEADAAPSGTPLNAPSGTPLDPPLDVPSDIPPDSEFE